ncbi:hypothetical protein IID22_03135 [Patescibacteria group bacterium]|nr:hypothetical protein [Patescibacteria group bacterium]
MEKYRTIVATKKYTFRIVGPEEKKIIKQAVKINNSRWGKHLQSNLKEFRKRAQNGLIIGVFDNNQVIGTISALQTNKEELDKIGNKGHWANTWSGITGNGALSPHNRKGGSLVCIAISTKLHTRSKNQKLVTKVKLNANNLKKYLIANEDIVIRFHRKPKARLKTGAKIVKIIPKGRPKDKGALGYNLLMKYPTLKRLPKINRKASVGTQLIEAALIYAYQNSLKHVYVYSRPADLNKHFK